MIQVGTGKVAGPCLVPPAIAADPTSDTRAGGGEVGERQQVLVRIDRCRALGLFCCLLLLWLLRWRRRRGRGLRFCLVRGLQVSRGRYWSWAGQHARDVKGGVHRGLAAVLVDGVSGDRRGVGGVLGTRGGRGTVACCTPGGDRERWKVFHLVCGCGWDRCLVVSGACKVMTAGGRAVVFLGQPEGGSGWSSLLEQDEPRGTVFAGRHAESPHHRGSLPPKAVMQR